MSFLEFPTRIVLFEMNGQFRFTGSNKTMKLSTYRNGRRLSALSDSVDDSSDVDSNISLGEFGNDPEIQEKVR